MAASTSILAPPTNIIQPMTNAPASAEKGQSNMKIKENVDVAGIKTRQIVEAFFKGRLVGVGQTGIMMHMAVCI